MKIIKDIRVFKSDTENIDKNVNPLTLQKKSLNVKIDRIVMKLREQGFSLGEFEREHENSLQGKAVC